MGGARRVQRAKTRPGIAAATGRDPRGHLRAGTLALSEDGVTFDRTWLVLHINEPWVEGFAKSARGGPQYPHVLTIGDALWVFYSIGKEQIGATRIPFSSLNPTANP